MSTIANLAVQLSMNAANFERGVGSALGSAKLLADRLAGVGRTMSMAVTAPLMGAAGAAIKFSTDFNAGLANTQSLGVAAERIAELKGNIQEMAVDVGKSTGDLADGLYQVVSAFGDSADTAAILEINAKAAAAGLATTTDAINLTSAITKGYGDTSAAAVQHASDLAFVTVKLGQTTFPELAASMGRVVPIAASLGVKQEELFAVMATATGVTGSAAEVSTQLRGALQSLMAPTDSMSELIASLGYESGAAMLQQEGLQGSIEKIVAAAEASGTPLQKYISSIEGQTLALALAGPQADAFTEKLAAMQDVTGASDAAFRAQAEGVNAAGFTMQQLVIKSEVLMQRLGDGLAPALAIVLDRITPLVDWAGNLAASFASLDSNTQLMIVAGAGLVAALGPLLTMLPMITAAVGALASPIGLVVGAVALLGAAWATNFGGIQDATMATWAAIQPVLAGWAAWMQSALPAAFAQLSAKASEAWAAISGAIAQASAAVAPAINSLMMAAGRLGAAFADMPGRLAELAPNLAGLGEAFGNLLAAIQPLVAVLGGGLVVAANLGVNSGINLIAAAFEQLPAVIAPIIDQIASSINQIAAAISGVSAQATAAAAPAFNFLATAAGRLSAAFADLPNKFAELTPNLAGLNEAFGNLLAAIQPLLVVLGGGLVVAANLGINLMAAAFERLPAILGPIIDQIAATINLIATTISGVAAAITAIAAGDWTAAWAAMQGVVAGVVDFMSSSWNNFIALLGGLGDVAINIIPPEWLAGIINWTWPAFPSLPGIVGQLLAWGWPAFPSLPTLLNSLIAWSWPSFPSMPGWLDDLLNWKWPSLPQLPSWLGGGGNVGSNASGTPYWRGGLTWVGEEGPELINLPRGTQIIPSDLSSNMASAGAGGVQITVNANISSKMDLHQLAYDLATEFDRWRQ